MDKENVMEFLVGLSNEEFENFMNEVEDARNCASNGDDDDAYYDFPEWLNMSNSQHVQFYKDMCDAGFEPYHYRGRYFFDGPGVNVGRSEEDDAVRSTKVRLNRDNMGLDMVLYPG